MEVIDFLLILCDFLRFLYLHNILLWFLVPVSLDHQDSSFYVSLWIISISGVSLFQCYFLPVCLSFFTQRTHHGTCLISSFNVTDGILGSSPFYGRSSFSIDEHCRTKHSGGHRLLDEAAFIFEAGAHVAQIDLEFAMGLRINLNSWSFCLHSWVLRLYTVLPCLAW